MNYIMFAIFFGLGALGCYASLCYAVRQDGAVIGWWRIGLGCILMMVSATAPFFAMSYWFSR